MQRTMASAASTFFSSSASTVRSRSSRAVAAAGTSSCFRGAASTNASTAAAAGSSPMHMHMHMSTRASPSSLSSFQQPRQQLLSFASTRKSGEASAARRSFSTSTALLHGGKGRPAPGTGIKVTFKNAKGELMKTVEANEGDDIVDLSWEHDLDIEAACEKSIACSTCHCILDGDSYDKLEEPSDEENDMLDMAFGLEDTSRLGCQVKITKDLDGMTVQLPSATRNFAVDGHKPKPH